MENPRPDMYGCDASTSSAILKASPACLTAAATAAPSRYSAGVRMSCQNMVVIGAPSVEVTQSIHFSAP